MTIFGNILFHVQLTAITEKSIKIHSIKNKIQSCKNTRYINKLIIRLQKKSAFTNIKCPY